MLDISRDPFVDATSMLGSAPPQHRLIRPMSAFANMRRHAAGSTALVVIFLGLGLGYALTSTPLYTASTDILIDARRSHAEDPGVPNRSLADLGMDPASIDSQVAVLGSEQMASTALKLLHLDHDATFAMPTTLPGVLLLRLRQALGRTPPAVPSEAVPADILDGFMGNLDVKRVQQTYVLSLSFSARTPDRAAAIVNTLATVYVDSQVKAAIDGRKRTEAWLKARIIEVRSEIAAAEQSVRSLRTEMAPSLAVAAGGGSPGAALVPASPDRLRDLERDLDDKRVLYGALVKRANALLQQQSMPVSDASVLKSARAPERKSLPNTPVILVLSALAGLAAALGLATWREMADKTFRLPSQVEAELGVRFLGVLPLLKTRRRERRVLLQADWSTGGPREGAAARRPSLADVVRASFSGPLRAVKLAADGGSKHDWPAVVGVTSAMAGEGRSTVAANLAGFMAGSGRRTLLIDADLQHPKLSRLCAPEHPAGLAEVIGGTVDIEQAVARNELTGVDLLPARAAGAAASGLVLGLDDLEKVLEHAGRRYDVVVLDLPPLSALAEVSVLAPAIGAFVLVIAWASTERAIVAEAVHAAPSVANRVVGAVLNRVNAAALRRLARDPKDLFHIAGAKRAQGMPA